MTKWRLEGYDTFEEEPYPLDGEYESQQDAEYAAEARLAELEANQPSESSGGQGRHGIQDRVFIIRPNGSKYRYQKSRGRISAVDCEVIVKETASDLIVRTQDGQNINMQTALPDVRKGHKGKIITVDGKSIFIREPYGGPDDLL